MKCIFVYNPTSGKRSVLNKIDYIKNELQKKFEVVEVRATTHAGEAGEIAEYACAKFEVLVVAGGDGTINEVVNAVAEKPNRPQIGYIPCGTTNDLAHSLKIPKNVKKAVRIILNGNFIKHDIFKVNDKYGIYVCAFGMCTGASYLTKQLEKNRFGKLAYYSEGIREFGHTKNFDIILDDGQKIIDEKAVLCLIVNSKYVGGFKINKNANASDGFVNVIIFKENKKRGVHIRILFKIARVFLFGISKLKRSKYVEILKLNKFKVDLPYGMAINIDGELGTSGGFKFEVLKKHIDIFVKK